MSTHSPTPRDLQLDPRHRIAIIAARFNDHVVGKLLDGCERRLKELGATPGSYRVFRVPGAFELPSAAQVAANSGWDAVIALGCVIRGETFHFDIVAGECAAGIREVGIRSGKPVIFGVLTVDTQAQADARSGGPHGHAGVAAADAAVEMLATLADLKK